MRGIAIALVFLVHADLLLTFGDPLRLVGTDVGPAFAFVRSGHTGVGLFFVLSGFLLAPPFLREALGGPSVSRRLYFRRRALRILPAYWTAVVIGAVATSHQVMDLTRALPYLAFLNGFGLGTAFRPWSDVWWSLATEVQFYLALPLVASLFQPVRRPLGAFIVAAWALAYAAWLAGRLGPPTIGAAVLPGLSLFGRIPQFLAGAAVAAVWMRYGARVRARLAAGRWWSKGLADAVLLMLVTLLGGLLAWVARLGFFLADFRPYQVWHVAEAALWAAVLLMVLLAPLRTKWLLANPLLAALGTISYSVYLVHMPLLALGLPALLGTGEHPGWTRRGTVAVLAMAAACAAVSTVTYRLVERPFFARDPSRRSVTA